jgi:predicted phage replisome organizer
MELLMADKWLKLAMDFCDDEKIKIIRAHEGGDTFIWLWLWFLTTAMKRETDTIYIVAGIPYEPEIIAKNADVKLDAVNRGMDLFEKLQMLTVQEDGGIQITNFLKHQSIAEMQHKRQLATERKRKQREKEAAQIAYNPENVTRDTCDSHATEESREEESREEESREEKEKQIPPKNPAAIIPPIPLPPLPKQEQQKSDLDTILDHWYAAHNAAGLGFYKTTKEDRADIAFMLKGLTVEKIKSLIDGWFAEHETNTRYHTMRITAFAKGYSRVAKSTKSSKDVFNKVSGWEGK